MDDQQTRDALPEQARVVVIGGGAIGTSIAYHLAKAGWSDVVLLERRQLTAGTTWHAAGLITSAGMASEAMLWMSRYTTSLIKQLEAETGQSTGFRQIGHLHIASTPQRLEGMRREGAFARGFGVPNEEISPAEVKRHWPEIRTDDILAGFWVPDEGRANPADVTQAYARGARMRGARIVEGVTVTGITRANGFVTGVDTDKGHIRAEFVVNAAGLWGREVGAMAGVSVPLQAAEHYYLITDTVSWAHPDLPVVEEPDIYGYYREEGGGILVGLFEPIAKAWSLDSVPKEIAFASLEPDWERIGPFLERALSRFPSLAEAGVRTMFCGPESFTTDNGPLIGEAPELRNFFIAAGLNSLGILLSGGAGSIVAEWIMTGVPPVDLAGLAPDRTQPFQTSRRYRRDKAVELLGTLFGDSAFPSWKPWTARNVRRSAIHDRLAADGAHFGVTSGFEYAEWFDADGSHPVIEQSWGRNGAWHYQQAEHNAVREAVGMLDMSMMANLLVQGRDAETVLNRVCANDVSVPVGRVVYTQWCNQAGGIMADLTVTRLAESVFLLVVTDTIHRRMAPWIERHTRDGEQAIVTDVSAGTTLMTVQGPRSRELLNRLTSADLSNEAFPYMTAQEIDLDYARVLAMRVTYVGELGWELHVPADQALTVYDALMANGADLGYRNVGMVALGSLRLEKAYRDMGLDIDATDTPLDVGLGFAVAWDKPGGFVGRDALLAQKTAAGPPKRRMIQFLVQDSEPLLYHGEPVLRDGRWAGYNRAGAYGHTLGGAVGLAVIEDEAGIPASAIDEWRLEVEVAGRRYPVKASLRPMYDPDRVRIKA
jgi:4-methylaminobutanoate oxidase (formaldehyde-forming)